MPNPIESMLNVLERDPTGVAVVFCPDLGLRDWLVEQVEGLAAPEATPVRFDDAEAAILNPGCLALLVPKDERQAVLDLDASRDRILQGAGRAQPLVLFLLRDGAGQRALAEDAPSLRSWVAGSDPDPEKLAALDVPAERAVFESRYSATPEAWLKEWRAGRLPQSARNFLAAHEATILEEPGKLR